MLFLDLAVTTRVEFRLEAEYLGRLFCVWVFLFYVHAALNQQRKLLDLVSLFGKLLGRQLDEVLLDAGGLLGLERFPTG